MTACVLDGVPRTLTVPKPRRGAGEVLIRVTLAGICNTDLEIARGYVPGFRGIPGHEFVGVVEEADDAELVGRRVTAEINCACGRCAWCRGGLGRHCPDRTVIGIIDRPGCFARYIAVPRENIVVLPETIPDRQAVFIEPMAAALEILDQVAIDEAMEVLVLGDGKLGQLVARALASTGCRLTVVGRHSRKLELLSDLGARTVRAGDFSDGRYDVVVEATGRATVLDRAVANTRPRGTLVLKSTYAAGSPVNLSPIVVDEITVVGSRCGRFEAAVAFIAKHHPPLEALIEGSYDLADAPRALEEATRSGKLKVVLTM